MRTRSALPLAVGLLLGGALGFAGGLVLATGGSGPGAAPGVEPCAPPPCPPAAGEILGRGPEGGYVLVVDPRRLRLEVVHNEQWGIAAAYLYDADMEPLAADEPPVLNLLLDGEPVRVEPGRENWDGEEDGGWHFEHDALLGVPEAGRWRLTVGGRTWSPRFRHVHLDDGHAPGHGHAAGAGAAGAAAAAAD